MTYEIVKGLSFDATRCEVSFSKGVCQQHRGRHSRDRNELRAALQKIADCDIGVRRGSRESMPKTRSVLYQQSMTEPK
jgi:hypothetical protein